MKLKTLKDLVNLDLPDRDKVIYGFQEILKQEAIKWIKHYGIKRDKAKDIVDCALEDGKIYALECFFNITEEDLKYDNKRN